MALLKKGRNAEQVKRELLERMFRKDAACENWIEPHRDFSPPEFEAGVADLRRRMAPFILPELAHLPIAFDVDQMTVREFAGAEIKPSVTDFSQTLLREWRSTYLDFPHAAARLDDGWYTRAVFVTQETSDTTKWSAILEDGRDHPSMILTWYVRENVGFFPGSLLGCDDDFSLFSSCGQWSVFIANLVYLCVAWFGTMNVPDKSRRSPDEQRDALLEQDRLATISAPADPSRFRLVKLTPPRAQRSWLACDEPNAATRSRHIMVRGHFKLVRYGERWRYARLKWVRSYERGPKDKPLETRVALFEIETSEKERNQDHGNGYLA
ncbi:hypothetical protein N2601_08715 [Rhizobium sp. CB3060]|uniref:hypothetical protein n=1 Tax=Rhizobium sp. CB3060 TaxID=3138255 RepID=UPI0021A58B56|nr:hypothetical protein [Rhizobium tropici]UWU23011.1 hypothetical protein N2601_08715 [Rhizobium tropici]